MENLKDVLAVMTDEELAEIAGGACDPNAETCTTKPVWQCNCWGDW